MSGAALLLVVHIVAGSAGLLLGPLYLVVPRSRPVTGRGYQVAVAATALSGAALAVVAWGRLWWLLPVAVATQVSAVAGWWMWSRRPRGWTTLVPHVLGGSYIALVTGAMVATTGNPVFWVLPAVVAQWPIAGAKAHLAAAGPEPEPAVAHS